MVNLRILANRQLATGVIFGLLLGFALYSSVFALPVFLQNLLGYTAWDTGKVILPGRARERGDDGAGREVRTRRSTRG